RARLRALYYRDRAASTAYRATSDCRADVARLKVRQARTRHHATAIRSALRVECADPHRPRASTTTGPASNNQDPLSSENADDFLSLVVLDQQSVPRESSVRSVRKLRRHPRSAMPCIPRCRVRLFARIASQNVSAVHCIRCKLSATPGSRVRFLSFQKVLRSNDLEAT